MLLHGGCVCVCVVVVVVVVCIVESEVTTLKWYVVSTDLGNVTTMIKFY